MYSLQSVIQEMAPSISWMTKWQTAKALHSTRAVSQQSVIIITYYSYNKNSENILTKMAAEFHDQMESKRLSRTAQPLSCNNSQLLNQEKSKKRGKHLLQQLHCRKNSFICTQQSTASTCAKQQLLLCSINYLRIQISSVHLIVSLKYKFVTKQTIGHRYRNQPQISPYGHFSGQHGGQ